jgi:nicotinamidase/pyrazinamidase
MRLLRDDVLLVVDVQRDFLLGGALAVPEGDAVVAPINRLSTLFGHVLLTQDWHPAGHVSFATSHPGRARFETVALSYGHQVLWPTHCVQGLAGYLRERGLRRLFLAGLATDFCVAWSALDARAAGFEAMVVEDACRGIDIQGSLDQAWRNMHQAGVERLSSAELKA